MNDALSMRSHPATLLEMTLHGLQAFREMGLARNSQVCRCPTYTHIEVSVKQIAKSGGELVNAYEEHCFEF